METRGLKKKLKERMGFGSPSSTSSRDKPSEATTSSEVGVPATTSSEVGGPNPLYGDHEGLENPQILETSNSGEQEIQFANTGNLGEQITSEVQANSGFQDQTAEISDRDARRHDSTMQEIRQLEEKKLQELALLRAEKEKQARRRLALMDEERAKLSQEIRSIEDKVVRQSQNMTASQSEILGSSNSGTGHVETGCTQHMEQLSVTRTVEGQGLPQGSIPDTNPIDMALKYINYFGTISTKIKPTDAVKWFEGLCQQLLIQNNERLKLNIALKSWPQEVLIAYSASVDRADWSYEGLRNTYLKRDNNLPACHQKYPIWSTAPAGHTVMTEARKRAACSKDDLIKFFALDMLSDSVRKIMMSDIHTDISNFERKLNAALAIAQEKPAQANYNSGTYHQLIYDGLQDGLCWRHKAFGKKAYKCEDEGCYKRGSSKNGNPSS